MNKVSKLAMALALTAVSASSQAWWGGPCSALGNEFFGDGGFSFGFSMRAGGGGGARYYDTYGPYGYPTPYLPRMVPPATLSEAQRAELLEQRKAFAEQQELALRQAVEAQRQFAERMARPIEPRPEPRDEAFDPMSVDPFAGFDPFTMDPPAILDSAMPGGARSALDQSRVRYEQFKAASQARREASERRARERREALQQPVDGHAPWHQGTDNSSI